MQPLTLLCGSRQTEAIVPCQGVASPRLGKPSPPPSGSEKEWDLQAFLARLPALEWGLLVTQPSKDSRLLLGRVSWATLGGAWGSDPSGRGQLAETLLPDSGRWYNSGCTKWGRFDSGERDPPCVLHGAQAVTCWDKSSSHCRSCFWGSFFNFKNFIIYLYWSIVDLQCCVSFWCTAKWFSYIYIYIYIYIYNLFKIFLSIMVYHRILNIVLCARQ